MCGVSPTTVWWLGKEVAEFGPRPASWWHRWWSLWIFEIVNFYEINNFVSISFSFLYNFINCLRHHILMFHMLTGLKFFKVHKHTKIQCLEKIKWNSKNFPLGIITLLLYHLKQASWQSMHKWRIFRTSKFTPKETRQNFFPSPQTH